MCSPKEIQEEFCKQIMEAIDSWFHDIVEDCDNKYDDDIDSDEVYRGKIEMIDECADFMKRIFVKLSGGVDLQPMKPKKSFWKRNR